jgi:DNA (cytosine-5)-methyltransferase 1
VVGKEKSRLEKGAFMGAGGDFVSLSSGLIVPEHIALERRRPQAVDLFCGTGGSSLGFIHAGWDIVAAVDHDPVCAITYTSNLGAYPCQFYWIEPSDENRMETALEKMMRRKGSNGLYDVPTSGSNFNKLSLEPFTGVKHFFLGDVRKLDGKVLLDILGLRRGDLDCLIGIPPCQGYSVAGKREAATD